jgi:hypothetical protein
MHMRGFFADLRTNQVKFNARFTLMLTLCLIGCHHGNGNADAAAQANNILSRLPAPVAAAFVKQHPHVPPARFHVRLFPDGTTHYQLMYQGSDGQPQQADYYGDGRKVPQ